MDAGTVAGRVGTDRAALRLLFQPHQWPCDAHHPLGAGLVDGGAWISRAHSHPDPGAAQHRRHRPAQSGGFRQGCAVRRRGVDLEHPPSERGISGSRRARPGRLPAGSLDLRNGCRLLLRTDPRHGAARAPLVDGSDRPWHDAGLPRRPRDQYLRRSGSLVHKNTRHDRAFIPEGHQISAVARFSADDAGPRPAR